MKKCMVTASENSEKGKGIHIYTRELIEELRKKKINMDLLEYRQGSFFSLIRLMPKLKKYDLIHIQHEYGLFGLFAGIKFIPFLIILKILTKSKLIITMHTVHDKKEKFSHKYPAWIFLRMNIFYPLQNKLIGIACDSIVVHTEELSKRLIYSYKIKKRKVVVIHPGVKEGYPIIKKSIAKNKLNIKGPLYLMMGNITPSKGFDIILKQSREIGKNIVLLGRGNKEDIAILKEILVKKKASKFAKLDLTVDKKGGQEKWWLYLSAADLILLPYKTMTTSGIIINAVQANKPVITSNSPYFREIKKGYGFIEIAKKDSDYPVLIKKTMKELKKKEDESRRFAEDFSFEKIIRNYSKLYEK